MVKRYTNSLAERWYKLRNEIQILRFDEFVFVSLSKCFVYRTGILCDETIQVIISTIGLDILSIVSRKRFCEIYNAALGNSTGEFKLIVYNGFKFSIFLIKVKCADIVIVKRHNHFADNRVSNFHVG